MATGKALQHKTAGPLVSFKADDSTGIVEAVVSVFNNIDSQNERVLPGAFAKSLEVKKPRVVWSHDWTKVIGKTLEATELKAGDPRLPQSIKQLGGLYVKGQFFMNTQAGRESFEIVKELGDEAEFSIGYEVVKDQVAKDGVRELIDCTLYEWSPVLVGANGATALIAAKNRKHDVLEGNTENTEADKAADSEDVAELAAADAAYAAFRAAVEAATADPATPEADEDAVIADLIDQLEDDLLQAFGQAPENDPSETPTASADLVLGQKVGRVLSSSNETALRAAIDALQAVLDASSSNANSSSTPKSEANSNIQADEVASATAGQKAGTAAVNAKADEALAAQFKTADARFNEALAKYERLLDRITPPTDL